jgi:hypothetical protein
LRAQCNPSKLSGTNDSRVPPRHHRARARAAPVSAEAVLRRLRRIREVAPYLARKLLALSPRELWDLVLAQYMILWAQAVVRMRPVGRLASMEGSAADRQAAASVRETGTLEDARRLALAVDRAASFGVGRPLCLARSVALNRMLELHGIRGSRIRIGVAKQGDAFAAHAWVEYRGAVLADHAWHVRHYSELSDMRVVKSA